MEASKAKGSIALGALGKAPVWLAALLTPWKERRLELLALSGLLVFAVLLYNMTTIVTMGNGIKHPDESASLILSDKFLHSGKLTYSLDVNDAYATDAFTPHGLSANDGEIGPKKAYGGYVFTAGGLLLGDAGPFVLVALSVAVTAFFAYATVRLFSDALSALAAGSLVALSYPFVYWSQSLYDNPVALAPFSAAIYLLALDVTRSGKASGAEPEDAARRANLQFAGIGLLLGLAALLRFEFVVFGALLLGALLVFPTADRRRLVVSVAAFGAVVLVILALNWEFFGSPFSVAYTHSSTTFETPTSSSSNIPLYSIYDRFLRHDIQPDFGRLYHNTRDWLWGLAPGLLILGTLGIGLQLARRGKQFGLWFGLTTIAVLWSYDTLGGYHWGEGTGQRGSVYGRYLLPTYYVLGLAAPWGIAAISSFVSRHVKPSQIVSETRVRYLTVGVLVALTLAMTPFLLFTGKGNITDDMDIKAFYRDLDSDMALLPPDAIIVANLHGKGIMSRPVLTYPRILGTNQEIRNETVRIVREAITDGRPVYLLETPSHTSTFLNVTLSLQHQFFQVRPLTVGHTSLGQVVPPGAGP